MLTRSHILAARLKEVAEHNQKMQVFDAFMKLIDPATDAVPQSLLISLGFPVSAHEPAPTQNSASAERPLRPIEAAILEFSAGAGEFTSANVRDHLESVGYALPANRDAAMNSISAALSELVERGKIFRTYQGTGRDPHRYSAIRKAEVE